MRNFVLFLFIGFGLGSCNHEKSTSFTINGQVEGVKDSTEIFLSYFTLTDGVCKEITDTTYLKNSRFYFKGSINDLTAASLDFNGVWVSVYIEPVPIQLVIDKNDLYAYKLSGTSVEKESIELRNKLSDNWKIGDQISNSADEIFKQINLHESEPDLVDSLMKKIDQIRAKKFINLKQI